MIPFFSASIFSLFVSTQITLTPISAKQVPVGQGKRQETLSRDITAQQRYLVLARGFHRSFFAGDADPVSYTHLWGWLFPGAVAEERAVVF